MMDLVNNIGVYLAKGRAQVTGDLAGTVELDASGFTNLTIVAYIETVAAADASNYLDVKVQECATQSPPLYTDVPALRISGSIRINDTAMAGTVKKLGIVLGTLRYVRVYFDETGTADVTLSVFAIFGGPRHAPVS